MKVDAVPLQRRHRQLAQQLSRLGPISQGSVQDRTRRKGGGAGYQWTRKVKGKTVTVSLTKDQFESLQKAVQNRQQLNKILRELEALSRQINFANSPNPNRRKRLPRIVLGTI